MRFIFFILSFFILFLQGCKEERDSSVGSGEIRHNGEIYRLYNVYRLIFEESNVTDEHVQFYNYHHQLIFVGDNWGTSIRVSIRSKDNELASGEFHEGFLRLKHEYNSIQYEINVADDFVHYSYYTNPAKRKINLTYTEKDGMFDIKLKYLDNEDDFLIKWEGPVKNEWW